MTQKALADALGLTVRGVAGIEAGGGVKFTTLLAISYIFKIDPEWLRTGRESQIEKAEEDTEDVPMTSEIEHAKLVQSLTKDRREVVEQVAKRLAEDQRVIEQAAAAPQRGGDAKNRSGR